MSLFEFRRHVLVFFLAMFVATSLYAQKVKNYCSHNPDSLKKIAQEYTKRNIFNDKTIEPEFKEFFFKKHPNDSCAFLFALAQIYFSKNDYVKAIKYSLQARNPEHIHPGNELISELALLTGNSYQRLSYYEKALYYYKIALYNTHAPLSPKRKNRCLLDIGNTYHSQNIEDSALMYYQMAKENALSIKDSLSIVASLVNIGNLYIEKKDFEKAEDFTKQALALSEKYKSDSKIICYFNLAQLNFEMRNYTKARDYFDKTIELISGSRFESLLPEIYKYLASIDYETGNYIYTLTNCRRFQLTCKNYYSNELFLNSLNVISRILIQMLPTYDSKELLYKNMQITDSVQKAEIEVKKNLEESFQELTKIEKNYKILEQQNQIQKEQLKLSRVIIISTVIILTLILVGFMLVFRSGKRIREQNKIIKQQLTDITRINNETSELNHEIKTQAEKIASQNEHLTNYQEHLEKLIEERTQALSRALERAHESDKLKTSFLQNISHEIRTPLNAISGFSQLLQSDSDENKAYIDIINQNIFDLLDMMENIMVFSRIHSNQLQPKFIHFKISMLIQGIEREIPKIKLKNKSNPVQFTINNSLSSEFVIYSDQVLLKKILVQLIENSYKYTEHGQISVNFEIRDSHLNCIVTDTGIGIREEQIPFIFDTFRKIEDDNKLYRGTGIGLAIVKNLTAMLNGEIIVDSEFGKGTKMHLKFRMNG